MYDDHIAQSEGWAVFQGSRGQEIQKIDEMTTFASDEDAWKHVVREARCGSRMHISALNMLHPEELELIKLVTGWEGEPCI